MNKLATYKKRKEKQIMETATIIVLSVLSTLSVVAIITLVVVSFFTVGRKIDELETNVFNQMREQIADAELKIVNLKKDTCLEHLEIRRELDSRCDKLDNKIKASNTIAGTAITTKQVLQG